MYAERLRRLRHVSATGRHSRDDVLAFKRFDRLLESDSVSDELTNDLIQSIIDAYH